MTVGKALVIGAGPGGLTAAIAVRQAGFAVEVFERRSTVGDVGSGLTLWPNALAALDELGIADRIRAVSTPVHGIEIRTDKGEVLDATGPQLMRRHFGGGGVVLRRADLQRALLEALGHHVVRYGTALQHLDIDGNHVRASFENGIERFGALAVAADGMQSVARRPVAGDVRLTYAGYTVWRGITRFSLSDPIGTLFMGRGAQFGLFPMPHDQVYWFASVATTDSGSFTRDALLSVFSGWQEPIEHIVRVTPPEQIVKTPVHEAGPFPARVRGVVSLVGDAAHPSAPTLGQGACQAIEDAVILGRCLAGGRPVSERLLRYEHDRVKRTNAMTKLAHQMGVIGHWQSAPACWLRDQLIAHSPMRARLRQLRWMFAFDSAALG